jgi:CheY-like chemotaxis protein
MLGVEILTEAGFHVIEASHAAEALAHLEAAPAPQIAVLFTDVNMPGSPDGVGLAQLVRQRWPDIKILVASGQVLHRPEDLPDAGRFMSKPYKPDELISHVRALAAA